MSDLWWTKWQWDRFSPNYICFPCQFSFHQKLHTHLNVSFGAGTIGQLVADVPSGFSLIPPHVTKSKALIGQAVPRVLTMEVVEWSSMSGGEQCQSTATYACSGSFITKAWTVSCSAQVLLHFVVSCPRNRSSIKDEAYVLEPGPKRGHVG
jgi:hypothetical protein